MNHYLKKNYSKIFGAGGSKDKGDPPPPAVLQPPKLGNLQAITSYSYSESIDLITDGPIEGLVNQNGQYIDGHRIFEGIYIDDMPIKKTIDPLNDSIDKLSFDLEGVSAAVSDYWLTGGQFNGRLFLDIPSSNLSYEQTRRTVTDPYRAIKIGNGTLNAEVLWSQRDIAKALFNAKKIISSVVSDSSLSTDEKDLAKQKALRFDGFLTYAQFEQELLQDYPLSDGFPLFCVRIIFGNSSNVTFEPLQETTSLININKYVNSHLDGDITNQVFQKLEFSEIGIKPILRVPSYIDATYLLDGENETTYLGGSIFIFGVQQDGAPTEESIFAIRDKVKTLYQIDSYSEKYNYTNVLAEIRNGDELQNPLGFFNKSYVEHNYGIKLLGPYSNEGQTLKIIDYNAVNESGIIDGLAENTAGASAISSNLVMQPLDMQNLIASMPQFNLGDYIFTDSRYYNDVLSFAYSEEIVSKKFISKSGDNFVFEVRVAGPCAIRFKRQNGDYSISYIDFYKEPGNVLKAVPLPFQESYVYQYEKNQSIVIATAAILAGDIEGSIDERAGKNYSEWSQPSISQLDEKASPVVHVVQNPNVERVFVTLGLRALSDTAEKAKKLAGTPQRVEVGAKIPSAVRFKIEIGLQDSSGAEEPPTKTVIYQIMGLAESPALIDIGRIENQENGRTAEYSKFIQGTENAATSLWLPPAEEGKLRYVKVTRTTYESYSVLIRREISLEKVTEVIDARFSYPNSAIVGIKLDSRTLSSLPPRSYDARLKRIMVPSNYYPLNPDGSDKRLYNTLAEFNAATNEDKLIYRGAWDGTFKEAWSDNPAWILFDLLTNRRYGIGNFISPDQINYWELYRIGRFCDAVDDQGYFVGVPSATGGREPRYSCNIIIGDKINVYDAIKNITNTFRGNIFYANSLVDFTDDRVKLPVMFFNNQNVKDGIFNYTNSRRDQQFNVIEVSYFDRTDSFKPKVEYVEDQDDQRIRGTLRTSIDTFGVTSRGHANRIGQHIIYSTVNENQVVTFVAGPEAQALRAGDLFTVEDRVKSLATNIGRVLDIDYSNGVLTLNTPVSGEYLPEITLPIATGRNTFDDYYNLAKSPIGLSVNDILANDVPLLSTFAFTGLQNSGDNCFVYLSKTGINYSLLNKARVGNVYSVTLSGLKQEVYKMTSIREDLPNEYEIGGMKFDTGKFGQIESGQNLIDFYNQYPNVVSPTQGRETIYQKNEYQLSYPTITNLSTGAYDFQADSIDISGEWTPVIGATAYDVELLTPRYQSITGRTNSTSFVFNDMTEAGRFSFRVSARSENTVPNEIGPVFSSGINIISYSAPVRSNVVFAGVTIGKPI